METPASAYIFLSCVNFSIETLARHAAISFAFFSCSAFSSGVGSGRGPVEEGALGSVDVCGAPAKASPVLPMSSIALMLQSIQYFRTCSALDGKLRKE